MIIEVKSFLFLILNNVYSCSSLLFYFCFLGVGKYPNVRLDGYYTAISGECKVRVVTIIDIERGQELLLDYGPVGGNNFNFSF